MNILQVILKQQGVKMCILESQAFTVEESQLFPNVRAVMITSKATFPHMRLAVTACGCGLRLAAEVFPFIWLLYYLIFYIFQLNTM